jgi:hypothetical protein
MLMTSALEEVDILHMASSAIAALADCKHEAIYLDGSRFDHGEDEGGPHEGLLDAQVAALTSEGGPVNIPNEGWAWAYPFVGLQATVGYFVVSAESEADEHARFLLKSLGQQAGVAIVAARLRAKEREIAEKLSYSLAIHHTFTQVAFGGEGEAGIAAALHRATQRSVAIEGPGGDLRVWAGPGEPAPYPVPEPRARAELIERLLAAGEPIIDGQRLYTVARTPTEALAVVALVHPSEGDQYQRVALEHAATVLTGELMRLAAIGETELRLGADLVDLLVTGTTHTDVRRRLDVLGLRAQMLQRVVVVEGHTRDGDTEQFFQRIRRAALDTGVSALIGHRDTALVLICPADSPWSTFRRTALAGMPGGRCLLGVGGVAPDVSELPRSYREALLAFRVARDLSADNGITVFDDLGIFGLFGTDDVPSVKRFIRRWIGPLIDYDAQRDAELTPTLSVFLEVGGHYAEAARRLSLHPSSLKYRLRRIRDVSGLDLSNPESRFNAQLATKAWRTVERIQRGSSTTDPAGRRTQAHFPSRGR